MSFPSNYRRWTGELLDYRTAGQLGDRWPVGSFITGRVVSTTMYISIGVCIYRRTEREVG